MSLSKVEIIKLIKAWLIAWNDHNLEGVMGLIHDDIVFENWTGSTVIGKNNLHRLWIPWFLNHGNFRFIEEDIFIDVQKQKVLFSWILHWPSLERYYKGKPEIRRGVDILHFKKCWQGVKDVDFPIFSGLYTPGLQDPNDFEKAIRLSKEKGAKGEEEKRRRG